MSLLELAIGRHLQCIFVLDRFDNQTLFQVACYGRRPAIAPLQQLCPRGELQTSLVILAVAVALVAPLDQQRPNVTFEEFDRLRIELRGLRIGRTRNGRQVERKTDNSHRKYAAHAEIPTEEGAEQR